MWTSEVAAGFRSVAGTIIEGNYIGTTADGTAALGNGGYGIAVGGTFASGVLIGGTSVADRNVISGNYPYNVVFENRASNDTLQGNYIGTNAAGTAALSGTYTSVVVQGSSNILIGGTAPGAGNVIAGDGGRHRRLRQWGR